MVILVDDEDRENEGDQNSGIELMLYGSILQNPRGLNWDMTVNASFNKNKIIDLYEGVNEYGLRTFDDVKIVARTGSYYGDIYGRNSNA